MKIEYQFYVRQALKPYILNKNKLLFIRPDNRFLPNPKGAKPGILAEIKFIVSPGDDNRNIQPILESGSSILVRIERMEVKKNKAITLAELDLLPDSLKTMESLMLCLGLIYNRIFSPEDEVTLFFLKKMSSAQKY